MHPGGKAVNTFQTPPRASGSNAPSDPPHRRFIIDFAGGNLPCYLSAPAQVQLVPSTSTGQITNTFLVPNHHTKGPRRHRREARTRPVHGPARLPARRQPGSDGDLDLSLVRGMINSPLPLQSSLGIILAVTVDGRARTGREGHDTICSDPKVASPPPIGARVGGAVPRALQPCDLGRSGS